MVKLILKNGTSETDVTELCSEVTWSGSKTGVAREVSATLLKNSKAKPALGHKLMLYVKGKKVFTGSILSLEQSVGESDAYSVTAYDKAIHLKNSTVTKTFKNTFPKVGTVSICSELGVPVGTLADPRISVSKKIRGDNAYSAIVTLYHLAAKQNHKEYMPLLYDDKLHVLEIGANKAKGFIVESGINLLSGTYSESNESMVNVVKIYKDGKYVGKVENAKTKSKYGTFQENYQVEEKVNSFKAAKSMLAGTEFSVSCTVLGNAACISGRAVAVKIKEIPKLKDLTMYIESDTHSFSPGENKYTMDLELKFKAEMDGDVIE